MCSFWKQKQTVEASSCCGTYWSSRGTFAWRKVGSKLRNKCQWEIQKTQIDGASRTNSIHSLTLQGTDLRHAHMGIGQVNLDCPCMFRIVQVPTMKKYESKNGQDECIYLVYPIFVLTETDSTPWFLAQEKNPAKARALCSVWPGSDCRFLAIHSNPLKTNLHS